MGVDLRKLIQGAVKTAFTKQLGNIPKDAVYVSLNRGYDTATSTTTNLTPPVEVTVKAVFVRKKDSLAVLAKLAPRGNLDTTNNLDTIEGNLPKLVALVAALQLGSVVPKTNDELQCEGVTYTIEAFEPDSAGAHYKLTLREP